MKGEGKGLLFLQDQGEGRGGGKKTTFEREGGEKSLYPIYTLN